MFLSRIFGRQDSSTRRTLARRGYDVETLEGRQLLTTLCKMVPTVEVSAIQGGHIGTNAAAIQGNHIGTNAAAIQGNHIGTSVAVLPKKT